MYLLDEPLFCCGVGERVSGHVKEDKALFLRRKDALLHQVLGDSLTDVTDLVAKIQRIPSLTC